MADRRQFARIPSKQKVYIWVTQFLVKRRILFETIDISQNGLSIFTGEYPIEANTCHEMTLLAQHGNVIRTYHLETICVYSHGGRSGFTYKLLRVPRENISSDDAGQSAESTK